MPESKIKKIGDRRQRIVDLVGNGGCQATYGGKLFTANKCCLTTLLVGQVSAYSRHSQCVTSPTPDHKNLVAHPDGFICLEVAKTNLCFSKSFRPRARQKLSYDTFLILREKEFSYRHAIEIIQALKSHQLERGFIGKEGPSLRIAHGDKVLAVVCQGYKPLALNLQAVSLSRG